MIPIVPDPGLAHPATGWGVPHPPPPIPDSGASNRLNSGHNIVACAPALAGGTNESRQKDRSRDWNGRVGCDRPGRLGPVDITATSAYWPPPGNGRNGGGNVVIPKNDLNSASVVRPGSIPFRVGFGNTKLLKSSGQPSHRNH